VEATKFGEDDLTAEPWVSVEGVTTYLGVAKDSVDRGIEGKGLPARRMGRLWKSRISEIGEWIRQGGAAASLTGESDESDESGGVVSGPGSK